MSFGGTNYCALANPCPTPTDYLIWKAQPDIAGIGVCFRVIREEEGRGKKTLTVTGDGSLQRYFWDLTHSHCGWILCGCNTT